MFVQGTVTDGEGSVQLTSFIVSAAFTNRAEPYPSVSVALFATNWLK
jgi:hypothetical protein